MIMIRHGQESFPRFFAHGVPDALSCRALDVPESTF